MTWDVWVDSSINQLVGKGNFKLGSLAPGSEVTPCATVTAGQEGHAAGMGHHWAAEVPQMLCSEAALLGGPVGRLLRPLRTTGCPPVASDTSLGALGSGACCRAPGRGKKLY